MEMLGDLPQSLQAIVSIVEKFSALVGRAKQDGASEEFTRDLNGAIIEMQGTIIAAQAVALEAQADAEAPFLANSSIGRGGCAF